MTEGPIRIMAVAVEDYEILVTVADGRSMPPVGDGRASFRYNSILPEPLRFQRSGRVYGEKDRQKNEFSSSLLLQIISDCLKRIDPTPDVVAISTFGTIDTKTGTISHIPSTRWGARAIVMDIYEQLAGYNVKVVVDNDATAAAFGEYLFGAGRIAKIEPHQAFAYVWAGRGLNAGIVINGAPWQGRFHPEMGHLQGRRYAADPHKGNCGSHRDCLTGLGGLRAYTERADADGWDKAKSLDAMAYYIAQLCAAVTLTIAPVKIVLGGFSFRDQEVDEKLFERIFLHYEELTADFPGYDALSIRDVIVLSQLGDRAGLLGIMEVGRRHFLPDCNLEDLVELHAH